MNALSFAFVGKIAVTIVLWCIPLIFFPLQLLEGMGLPVEANGMFLRLLGWGYLALCVGYAFGLREATRGNVAVGPIWAGIVSNGGACVWLAWFGLTGTWDSWHQWVQVIGWVSVVGTAIVTLQLIFLGLLSSRPKV